MFNLQDIQAAAKQFVADNATVILTSGGVVGTVTTGVLAWRGGYKTATKVVDEQLIRERKEAKESGRTIGPNDHIVAEQLTTQEKFKLGLIDALPPIGTGAATITAIIFAHRMNAQKAAALAALYGISQKQFEEYKEKVREHVTGPKENKIETELSQARVDRTPGSTQVIVMDGDVLCFDEPTGRYFNCSMEQLRRAVNAVNEMVLMEDGASASMFYEMIGLPETTWSQEVGFNMDNLCELSYNYVEGENNKPCLSINFKNMPVYEYHRRY